MNHNLPSYLLIFVMVIVFPFCTATSQVANTTADAGEPDPTRFASDIEKFSKISFDDSQDRIVFTGSSSIRFWPDIHKYYPDYQVINTGFGGSQMSDLRYYLNETVLRFSPRQVFIYEGDNDVSAQRPTSVIMENTRKVVDAIRQQLPNTEIVLISAKPSVARWQLKPQYETLNAAFESYANSQKNVKYANVWDNMLDEQGVVRKDIFIADNLHMNTKGYELWDQIIGPMVGFDDGWKMLFNGKDFNNFEKLNGTADYEVVDGQMVGTSRLKTPNTFLATKEKYGDFILEFEVLVDNGLNSGVQFRSLSLPEYNNGRVHGYQCEIETSSRKWAGGIYDEARRAWLYPLSRNEKGRHAFVPGEWNHYRIEAIGNKIRTWVNDVQCANLVDDMTAEGIIAFQVHGIYSEEQEGKKVRWRNIRIKTSDLENARKRVDTDVPEFSYLNNQLTEHEKRTGWRLLWDGQTDENWQSAKMNKFPSAGWTMQDGILQIEKSPNYLNRVGGDIITQEQFSDFELSLDFKLTEGANSGIKYFVNPKLLAEKSEAIGLEYQLLDDRNHPDAKQGKNGNRTVASLYDLIRAESNTSFRGKNFKGYKQWNNARIVVRGSQVEHWLNHVKVVSYDRHSQLFRALVEKSKYENYEDFGQIPMGYILLQDHGDVVSFRNIKIREF